MLPSSARNGRKHIWNITILYVGCQDISWFRQFTGRRGIYIKKIEIEQYPQGHFYYENPNSPNSEIQLKNATSTSVEIENANYVLMQGSENEQIRRLKAYTNLIALDSLEQIASVDTDKCSTMIDEKPYVKKYILK